VSGAACAARALAALGPLVTSARPTLRWARSAPADGAQVELCRDAACSAVVATVNAAGASSARPASALAAGVYFWRLRPMQGATVGAQTSPAWSFVVPARTHATNDFSTHQQFDENNDGSPDLLVQASEDPAGMPREAHVVYVRSGRFAQSAAPFRREAGMGRPIGVGDVNGDGRSDILVGGSGGGCLYFGSASGPVLNTCDGLMAGSAGLSYSNVTAAGDVNDDGYADVIVSGERGSAFVRYGSRAGLGGPRDEFNLPVSGGSSFCRMTVGDFNADGAREVALFRWNGATVAPPTIVSIVGGVPSDAAKRTLTWNLGMFTPWIDVNPIATDVNGDGFQDLLIALRSNDFPRVGGRIVVYLGSATGLPNAPSQIISHPDGGDDLFGEELDRAGDLDGDGFEDVIVSSPQFNSRAGRVYVYRGSAAGLSTTPAQTLTGGASNEYFGFSVAALGPIDRGSQLAIVVGAWGAAVRRGALSMFVNGGAPLIAIPAETAANNGLTPGYGYQLSSIGN
jgi:hypothetical protein